MDAINFPSQYKKGILNKTKSSTIRTKKELGKYKTGHIYLAQSYTGDPWKQKIIIVKIIKTTFDKLKEHNIPAKTINSIKNNEKIKPTEPVEIINFKYYGNTATKEN